MNRIFYFLICVLSLAILFPIVALSQLQKDAIEKIVYEAAWGGCYTSDYSIYLEIADNGSIRMYNSAYDSSRSINNLLEHGGGEISLAEFKKLTGTGDTLIGFYEGRISKIEYNNLVNTLINRQDDTCKIPMLYCCDIEYESLKVFTRNNRRQFHYCSRNHKNALMSIVHNLAFKKGYSKSKTRFSW